MAFENPTSTQFPLPDITTPRRDSGTTGIEPNDKAGARADNLEETTETTEEAQDTTLVDAVASSMVGEVLWKYVQKRKSFGIGESSRDFAEVRGSHVRHKRWVWVNPHEQRILWSAKQPMTGAALLGKAARKRKF